MKVLSFLSIFHLGIVGHLRTRVDGLAPNINAFHHLYNLRFGFELNVVTSDEEFSVANKRLQNDDTSTVVIVGGGK